MQAPKPQSAPILATFGPRFYNRQLSVPGPMLPFKLVYSEKYFLPIGEHIFRADKFRLIRERLLEQGVAQDSDFVVPQMASEADVLLVHSPMYVNKLMEGGLSAREEL